MVSDQTRKQGKPVTATNPYAGVRPRLVHGFAVPAALERLAAEIEASRALSILADDWDEAGSPGYAEETWRRAVGFLVWIATRLWEDHGDAVAEVDVLPGSRGNVDFEIRLPDRRLLVSVPVDSSAPVRYFGQGAAETDKIKGVLDPEDPPVWLLGWLAV